MLNIIYLFIYRYVYVYCFAIYKYFIISVHILILTFTNKTALGKITFVTRFLPSENKLYTYIHTVAQSQIVFHSANNPL